MHRSIEDKTAPPDAASTRVEAPVAGSSPASGALAGAAERILDTDRLLSLQRSAGNRAAVRALGLARQPSGTPSPPVQAQPQTPRSDDELTNILDEAMDRSPTFYRFYMMITRRGYSYTWGLPGQGTYTDRNNKLIVIDPMVNRQAAIIRAYYEVGNALFDTDFDRVAAENDAHRYRTGEDYARAVLKEEAGTVVWASVLAREAGMQ